MLDVSQTILHFMERERERRGGEGGEREGREI
jgi:hypothetical protein